eukprot:jgi/Botrbrau1/16253/Bobra.0066s0038.1
MEWLGTSRTDTVQTQAQDLPVVCRRLSTVRTLGSKVQSLMCVVCVAMHAQVDWKDLKEAFKDSKYSRFFRMMEDGECFGPLWDLLSGDPSRHAPDSMDRATVVKMLPFPSNRWKLIWQSAEQKFFQPSSGKKPCRIQISLKI